MDNRMTISTNKLNNSQILKLFLIAALLIITPLLSASLRSTYLYFVVNILIVVVGAESGLLSFLSSSNKPHAIISEFSPHHDHKENTTSTPDHQCSSTIVIRNCPSSDKINVDVGEERQIIEESPSSTPSIFFIGGEDQSFEDEREEVAGEVSGQELFQKAETFIGNFYKQLKMQREDSWKKLHDIYHKAF